MRTLYQPERTAEVKQRIAGLKPTSPRQWGKMNVGQALAHCSAAMEMAVGVNNPSRMFIGRLLGGLVKSRVLKDEEPMRRNAPTAPTLVVADERNLDKEKERLTGLIDRFASAGPQGCTTHPHTFFGKLTPEEWARMMYKHLDHHLRQFGA